MTISDYYDIEILASREGITPSRYMARMKERQKGDKERQDRFHEAHKGYRTEQSRKFREKHPGYYSNARKDRSAYFHEYYKRRKVQAG